MYRAVQLGVGRAMAVKIIHSLYANQPEFIRRFEAEGQVIARLEHPYIVPLYDYWREADGAYLVMRFMAGGSLKTILEAGGLDLDTCQTHCQSNQRASAPGCRFAPGDTGRGG